MATEKYSRKEKEEDQRNDFWWDIENDFMFWKKNDVFQSKFVSVIYKKA